MKSLWPFIKLLWPHRGWVMLAMFFTLLTLLANIGLLALSGWFLSASAVAGLSVASAYMFDIFTPSAGIRAFAIARTAGRYAERVIAHETTLRLLSSLRIWFYTRIEPQAPASLYRYRSGDLLGRIVTDIDTLDTLFVRVLSPTIAACSVAAISGFLLWLLAPALAAVFLIFFAGAGLLIPLLAQRLARRIGARIQQQMATIRMNLIEDIQGTADLIVYGVHHRHRQFRLQENDRLLSLQEEMARINGFCTAMMTLFSGCAAIAALYLAIPMAQAGRFDGAMLALITFGILAAFEAVLPLPPAYQMLGKIHAAAHRILEVTRAPATVSFETTPAAMPADFDIMYHAITFTYPETTGGTALHQVTFRLAPHAMVALVGPSGCGKTTLAHLLTRFWDPDQGRITIGGTDLRRFTEAQLRQMVTLVSQKSHIFNATLRDNLLIADPGADEKALWAALVRAQLADFVAGLPEGLDTWNGEGGARLSGGEARRLILARALLKNAPVWLLDEPTEGLDNLNRRRFMETLFANRQGKSMLLITHDVAALQRMDQIYFMERGRIICHGRHRDLLDTCERYRHFIGTRQPT
ncbi:thiol reductant ABC exporter subunit CydC [Desulfobulbus alkaliphilus]|uniref:thiol reductant ABC exporter subunit CydC n=1 Tax=Desulfobulbus alkaliphilus TaxID=869814 RepID=UPI0019638D1E|nr:thiol reductant ABC exporter subunit CydC [Desulfobulbus alkaliphilus]MBM9535849.1 thiol reductant ABC exporter subunit CydC [Desulfobulbus alkaliphilus]